jgi:hypothetical protein
MALSKTFTTNTGLVINNAYCKVENLLVTKDRIRFSVNCYVDNSGKHECFTSFGYNAPYVIDETNPIKQAYEFAKIQKDFASSFDI